jgi:XTP/dITP diphosphohydrolase
VDQIEATWHQVKKQEQPAGHAFTGIPAALPALALAQKSLDRASRAGLALDTVGPAGLTGAPRTEEDLGELLLAVVRSARENGLDAERALRAAVRRFQDRTACDGQAQSESSL